MFLTAPQSRHYDAGKFRDLSPRANHFDWGLFYRFQRERETFWLGRVEQDPAFRRLVEAHFAAFQKSVEETLQLLEGTSRPRVLDVGLSSDRLDRALITRAGAEVTVLDVQPEAARYYERVFGSNARFILGDVLSFAAEERNRENFDLVYSVGLIEHFPDKSEILDAHVALVKPGGLLLLHVPIDSEDNRRLTALAADWENFGYRELLTPDELRTLCGNPRLSILSAEAVGFFASLWARKIA
jgi:2-polyprenyl-3-methyl-5-hydroxy-6-metoxy-1,4-benzoquinol methylase